MAVTVQVYIHQQFVCHETGMGTAFKVVRREDGADNILSPLTVNYSITGTGSSEVDVTTGSVVIPANRRYARVNVFPQNAPTTPGADRTATVTVTSGSYVIGGASSKDMLVKDEEPLKAFPSAEGAGAYTVGGRGGTVLHVTNLNDSGAGSLREAMTSTFPRIIVFDVGGIINLTSGRIRVTGQSAGYMTILGQTAPGDGITVTSTAANATIDNGLIRCDNTKEVIIRHMKFRHNPPSDEPGGNSDVVEMFNITDVIVDHCSVSHGIDEIISFNTTTQLETGRITLSNTLLAQGDPAHNTGTIMGGLDAEEEYASDFSYIKNYATQISHRFPNFAGMIRGEAINNIVYNWRERVIQAGYEQPIFTQIGNLYKGSTETGATSDDDLNKIGLFSYPAEYAEGEYPLPMSYAARNRVTNSGSDINVLTGDGWSQLNTMWFTNTGYPVQNDPQPTSFKLTEAPWDRLAVPVKEIIQDELQDKIFSGVGANKSLNADGSYTFNRDSLDQGYIDTMINDTGGTFPTRASWSIPAATNPDNNSPYTDTSGDGMPDVWKTEKGLNPATDDSAYVWASGYIGAEEFFNEVDTAELYTTQNALSIYNETNSSAGITLLNSPTISVVTGDSAVGDYYVRLVGGGGGNEAMQWSWNGLTVGNDYTFSYWARKVGTGTPYGNNWTNVIDVDGVTPKDPASNTANITSTSWTKYSYDLKVQREGGIAKIYIAGDGTGEVHVTGFSVKLLTDNSFQGLQRAFPTAYGAGSNTYGGRGGAAPVLVKVNTLNPDTSLTYDGVSNTWSGGFKDACNNSTIGDNGRIIIFTVSGNIDLGDTNFDITTPYVTILGQSAPLGGITIHSGGLRVVNTHQVIIRYLRCRNGLITQAEWDAGGDNSPAKACGLSAVGFGHDLIFDHVSASWGGDKAILLGGNTSSTNQKRQTVQRCIASDSHTYFQMSNQRPDILVTYPNSINLVNYRDNLSVYYTLFARGLNRTPNIGGTDGYIDVINNIVQSNGTKLGVLQMIANAKVNWNRNYYSYLGSGDTPIEDSNEFQMNYVAYDHNAYYEDLQIHTRGNYYKNTVRVVLDGTENVDKNDNMEIWSYEYGASNVPNNTPMPDNLFTVEEEFEGIPNKPPLKTATDAYTSVITERNAGACHYIKDDGTVGNYLDSWDTDLFTNYEAETMQQTGVVANWVLPSIPSNTRPAGFSTIDDGIEDSWRASNMSGEDYNDFAPSGYMWIEEFYNQVDGLNTPSGENTEYTLNENQKASSRMEIKLILTTNR